MNKTLTLEQADALVTKDDRVWWETWGKTLVRFTPSRFSTLMSVNGYRNPNWRGKNKWGTIQRVEVNDQGLFVL